ncbi:aminotransferase class I/II-fold pyridoxal phosphate-dependent enzyme [Nonomuraea cypriaca]|uniref:aminotransferase class I/II-fold pyridoxal phosphate-dependent enzyme n=1 Tax=Nonomuraea cypriaca TaxID=1187855 RepID=UPI001A9C4F71|nr:aminotransferase class I/II-fold pyridoxal phosphate-dependent enzyme [Nonomuraea cypriaca]
MLEIRPGTAADREWIYRLRHEVYARELGQHAPNQAERLTDALDGDNVYLVAANGAEPAGFVSVTPPWAGRYSIDKYLSRDGDPLLGQDGLFEIRILTVAPRWRGSAAAVLLMHAALRWVAAHGGRTVVALGRAEILGMYVAAGLTGSGTRVRSGAVTFEVLSGQVDDLASRALRLHGPLLRALEPRVRWSLDMPFLPGGADGCQHGGASIGALGSRFDLVKAHGDVVPADVLDAWFSPAPGVVKALGDDRGWLARTSPPAYPEGLVQEIAERRGLPEPAIAAGAGSSDLIFRALRGWLDGSSRVLLLDPAYGEYAHVVERVIGCRADRFPLRRADGWRLDPDRLRDTLRKRYDLVVVVNPNNPTGLHTDAGELRRVIEDAPGRTRFWVDEAYIEYVAGGQSLEAYAAASDNVVVCKSMSKMYALSGLRVAYLAGPDRRRQRPARARLLRLALVRDPDSAGRPRETTGRDRRRPERPRVRRQLRAADAAPGRSRRGLAGGGVPAARGVPARPVADVARLRGQDRTRFRT